MHVNGCEKEVIVGAKNCKYVNGCEKEVIVGAKRFLWGGGLGMQSIGGYSFDQKGFLTKKNGY
jgi:hypothetical protein